MSRRSWGALGVGLALSLLLFGLPVLGHFGSRLVAADPIDSSQFMWFFAWWPHALLHGLNPFVTTQMFYPDGVNLTWATSMPGPSMLLSPVTLAFGPSVTWNLIQLLSPALSSWTAYLLCRHLTGRHWPSLAGGLLFGFSPYVQSNLMGGPYLACVALLPVMVLLSLRALEGELSPRRFVVLMALTLAGQYLISSEVLATSALFGGVALVLALALMPGRRQALIRVIRLLVAALAACVVLISPFLAYFFFGHQSPPGAVRFDADLASFVLPSRLQALQFHSGPPFVGSNPQSYLGLPLVALLALWLWRARRRPAARLLAGCLLVGVVATLGEHLDVKGHHTGIPLPWAALRHLPVLRYAIPVRFAVFVVLPAAIVLALWLAEARTLRRWRARVAAVALAAAALVVIAPDAGNRAWDTPISAPAFFAQHTYRHYLSASDHVLTVPVWGPNQWWVAAAGFPFPLTAGYAGNPFPSSYTRYPTYVSLLSGRLTADYAVQLRRFLAAKRVTAIVVQQGYPGPWRQLFSPLGVRPLAVGGVWLYRL